MCVKKMSPDGLCLVQTRVNQTENASREFNGLVPLLQMHTLHSYIVKAKHKKVRYNLRRLHELEMAQWIRHCRVQTWDILLKYSKSLFMAIHGAHGR